MVEKTTNDSNDAKETVDAASIGKAANPISKGTLIMIAAVIVFMIIAGILISRFFSNPTGGDSGSGSSGSTSTTNR